MVNLLKLKLHLLLYLCLIYFVSVNNASSQGECVGCWAEQLGNDLWQLGKIITKSSEIKSRYQFFNAQVEEKDPSILLAEIIENIARMMDRKMDAVKCIVKTAEEVAEQFEFNETEIDTLKYYNSKYSFVEGEEWDEEKHDDDLYNNMTLISDTHFYDLCVNTNFSSVHVPTNIYDKHLEPMIAIQWSKALDDVFRANYNSDPSLSWQYFASSSGIIRHYPAMKWHQKYDEDEFDARIRTWFIEASTCTKDAIILLDNSGSMAGMRKHIATLTVNSILDTFSNNDYINVLNYSTIVNYTIPCFENMLVQATKENIRVFKSAIADLKPNDKSNLGIALNHSLGLLKRKREERGCENDTKECNQAIMLVTDGVTEDFDELFRQYNLRNPDNTTTIPVRVFTYLIGKEVSHVEEIKTMACSNRGYYSHVQALEQVTASVFKYIPVVARPLVLQGVEHPASWTHAYTDDTFKLPDPNNQDADTNKLCKKTSKPNEALKKLEPFRLLTSVAVPAFDTKVNKNNETRTADLLGVAGTDVPIDDIGKLTFPYKIGVNGYAFVVSNNGYVLMHPDLRPIYEGELKENCNSVDLTEVEQFYDDFKPREISPKLRELRENLVNGVTGSMKNITLKYHYDDNRRISRETYDYYFAPLQNTPFSVGLAIPSTYGKYELKVNDEIQKNKHTGIKLETFFNGTNWKVHPKWVYCRYHYLEGKKNDTPEEELLHFLKKMYNPDFVWRRQYEAAKKKTENTTYDFEVEDLDEIVCGRTVLSQDDYYCDKQLITRLIFDARNTGEAFKEPWKFKDEREEYTFKKYNATLRFVATMSGLTRWEYIFGEDEDEETKEFGDWHARSINENWYKSAILQHQYDIESFVYSVPFDSADQDDILVTGSYAIFPKDAGKEAPGSVVGFQFSHSHLVQNFFNIATKTARGCQDCTPCGDQLDCYLIDSSGFIVVAPLEKNNTGKFFGKEEGDIMDSMIAEGIFEKITLYDFQGVCEEAAVKKSDGSIILNPLSYISWFINLLISKIIWVFVEINLRPLWDGNYIYVYGQNETETKEPVEKSYMSCDQQKDLFILNQKLFLHGKGYVSEVPKKPNSRPFYMKRIPNSNLYLIAINQTQLKSDGIPEYAVKITKIDYKDIEYPCQKLNLNNLTRRRLSGCFNEDPLESEIKDCGGSNNIYLDNLIVFICMLFYFVKVIVIKVD